MASCRRLYSSRWPGWRNILKAWRGMGLSFVARQDGGRAFFLVGWAGREKLFEGGGGMGFFFRPPPRRGAGAPRRARLSFTTSEVELADIRLVKHIGRAEQDLAAVDHLQFAEFARLDL